MPPRPDPRNRGGRGGSGDANPDIARLVAEQLAAAIPNIVTQVTTGMNAHRNEGTGGRTDGTQGCSYKSFMSCKPREFHGKEGAVGLIKWIENMETVLHISGCAEGKKVEFASCQLQNRAATWWKTQMQIRGREAAYLIPWDEFVNLLMEEYCSKDERQKLEEEFWNHAMIGADIESYTVRFHELARLVPHMVTPEEKRIDRYIWGLAPTIRGMVTSANPTTIQSAVVLANRLTNDRARSGSMIKTKPDNKRKAETSKGRKTGEQSNKQQRTVRNFGATTPGTGPQHGTNPKCNKCNLYHQGNCPLCNRCGKPGHVGRFCLTEKAACYECGSRDHFRNACPRLVGGTGRARGTGGGRGNQNRRNNQGNHGGQGRGRAFVIGAEEARQDTNVVTGTFLLNDLYVSVLFDSGADKSFISTTISPQLNMPTYKLGEEYNIELANGQEIKASEIIKGVSVKLEQ